MKQIIEALNLAMQDVGLVSKDSVNSHHKYKFTSEAEIISAIRQPFMAHGLVLAPSNVEVLKLAESGKLYRYDLLVTYKCLHTSGESLDIVVAASGADSQDKALPKAMTMALKYALIQLMLVARGVDPDQDGDLNAAEVRRWAQQYGGLAVVQRYCRANGKPDPLQWPSSAYFDRFDAAVAEGSIEL
jgi:hypothetical protein